MGFETIHYVSGDVLKNDNPSVSKIFQPVEKVLNKLISKERRMVPSVLRTLNQSAPETTPSPK